MVGIAQLAERLVVVQEVAGSNPVTHPDWPVAQAAGTTGRPDLIGAAICFPLRICSTDGA